MKRSIYTLALALCAGGMLAGTAQAQCSSGSEGQRAQCCHTKCYNQTLISYETCFNACMGKAILGRSSDGRPARQGAPVLTARKGSAQPVDVDCGSGIRGPITGARERDPERRSSRPNPRAE